MIPGKLELTSNSHCIYTRACIQPAIRKIVQLKFMTLILMIHYSFPEILDLINVKMNTKINSAPQLHARLVKIVNLNEV